MPDKKVIDLHLIMTIKDLRSLVVLMGCVCRAHAGTRARQLLLDDLMNAIEAEQALKIWDMLIKHQVDIDLKIKPADTDPEPPITIEIPIKPRR